MASPSWCVAMATVLSDFLGQLSVSCSLTDVHMLLDINTKHKFHVAAAGTVWPIGSGTRSLFLPFGGNQGFYHDATLPDVLPPVERSNTLHHCGRSTESQRGSSV